MLDDKYILITDGTSSFGIKIHKKSLRANLSKKNYYLPKRRI